MEDPVAGRAIGVFLSPAEKRGTEHGPTAKEMQAKIGQLRRPAVREKAPAPKEDASTPKPRWVFHTVHGADIIVQSKKARLSLDDRVAALQQALEQANVNHVVLTRIEAV